MKKSLLLLLSLFGFCTSIPACSLYENKYYIYSEKDTYIVGEPGIKLIVKTQFVNDDYDLYQISYYFQENTCGGKIIRVSDTECLFVATSEGKAVLVGNMYDLLACHPHLKSENTITIYSTVS